MLTPGSSVLLFLPLSHILARVMALCVIHAGRRTGYLADLGRLPTALAAFRPTILLAVPRVFEKLAAAAHEQADVGGHRRLFAAAEAAAVTWSQAGRQAGPLVRLRHAVFGRLVYVRVRPSGAGWPGRSAAGRRWSRCRGLRDLRLCRPAWRPDRLES